MKSSLPLPSLIIYVYIIYLLFSLIMKKIRFKAENLEELDGEFIFTFIRRIRKKEIYFNINEVKMCVLSRMLIIPASLS